MFEEIKKIIKEYSNHDINLDTDLKNELDLTSFDIVSLVGDIEEKYGVQFTEEDLTNISTIKDIIDYIEAHK